MRGKVKGMPENKQQLFINFLWVSLVSLRVLIYPSAFPLYIYLFISDLQQFQFPTKKNIITNINNQKKKGEKEINNNETS